MALTVTHQYVSPVIDDGVPSEVGPGEWNAAHAIAGTPDAAGLTTQVQFNDGGVLGAEADFTWDKTSNTLTLGSASVAATIRGAPGAASSAGTAVLLTSGAGTGLGASGALTIKGGSGVAGGGVGLVTIQGGDGYSGIAGHVNIKGGAAGAFGTSVGGNVAIAGGTNGASGSAGGSVTITGADSSGPSGGSINLTAGAAGAVGFGNASAGGAINLTAGTGGTPSSGWNSGLGGPINIIGGTAGFVAGAAAPAAGGLVTIRGGAAASFAGSVGGAVAIAGAAGTSTGTGAAGGAVTLSGGAAGGSGNNNGGDIVLTGGAATGTGRRGNVSVGGTGVTFTLGSSTVAMPWGNTTGAVQMGLVAVADPFGAAAFSNNLYFNASWKYAANGAGAMMFADSTGRTTWYTAPTNASGAGAEAAIVARITLLGDGSVGIGTASPTTRLQVAGGRTYLSSNSSSDSRFALGLQIDAATNPGAYLGTDAANNFLVANEVGTQIMRVTTAGVVVAAGGLVVLGGGGSIVGGLTTSGRITMEASTGAISGTGNHVLEVRSGGPTDAAFMAFHLPGAYAVNLGVDTDQQLKFGGWSAGAVAHRVLHEGNSFAITVNALDASWRHIVNTAMISGRAIVGGYAWLGGGSFNHDFRTYQTIGVTPGSTVNGFGAAGQVCRILVNGAGAITVSIANFKWAAGSPTWGAAYTIINFWTDGGYSWGATSSFNTA